MSSTHSPPSVSIQHPCLGATLLGVRYEREGVALAQFRGVKYATVTRRWGRPEGVRGLEGREGREGLQVGEGEGREFG